MIVIWNSQGRKNPHPARFLCLSPICNHSHFLHAHYSRQTRYGWRQSFYATRLLFPTDVMGSSKTPRFITYYTWAWEVFFRARKIVRRRSIFGPTCKQTLIVKGWLHAHTCLCKRGSALLVKQRARFQFLKNIYNWQIFLAYTLLVCVKSQTKRQFYCKYINVISV